jgi:hypothetical protein
MTHDKIESLRRIANSGLRSNPKIVIITPEELLALIDELERLRDSAINMATHRIVPVEPTEAMLRAVFILPKHTLTGDGDTKNIYRAMLEAAPLADSGSTPSSHWKVTGEKDPHAGHYDGERSQLSLGNMTDDELANAVFMHGNEYPKMDDVIAGKAKMPIVYLTAAKDRIRWLSRALERAIEALKQVKS